MKKFISNLFSFVIYLRILFRYVIILFFIFENLSFCSVNATAYTFPGNAFAGMTLSGAGPDTLLVQNGAIFNGGGIVVTVTADGGTSTTNNGTIESVVGAFSLTGFRSTATAPYNASPSTITNNGTIVRLQTDQNVGSANYAPFNITNSGTIQALLLFSNLVNPAANPYIVNNQGLIQNNLGIGEPNAIILGVSGIPNNTLNATINNNGTITSTGGNAAILTPAGANGPETITINNNTGGVINGDISNAGNDGATPVIYIFNAGAGSTLNGNYTAVAPATNNANQFNSVADSGSVSLGGNITGISLITAQSGTLITNGFNITGFNSFNVLNGATVIQNGASTVNGPGLTTSGQYNFNSGTLTVPTITINSGGLFNGGTFGAPTTNININSGGGFNQAANITSTVNVSNSGTYSVSANPIPFTLTGNYLQTPNGAFSPSIISSTNYGSVNVTGSTTFQGGTIQPTSPNGFQLVGNGDAFNILTGLGPFSFSPTVTVSPVFVTLNQQALFFTINQQELNNNIVQIVAHVFPIPSSLQSLANAISTISQNPPTAGLRNLIQSLANSSNFISALAQLEPNVYQAAVIPNLTAQMVLLDKISCRLDTIRAASDFGRTGYMAGDLAGTCASMGPIFYTNVLNQEADQSFPGYTANNYGLGFVGDAQVAPYTKVGAGLGLSYTVVQPNGIVGNFGNQVKITNIQPLVYASLDYKPFFLDAMFSLGYNSYNSERNIIFLDERATANYSGMQYSYFLRTGMVLPGYWFELTVPLISYQYAKVKQKPFTEVGAGAANLSIPGQINNYTQFSLGGKLAIVNHPEGFYIELHGGGLLNTNSNRAVLTTASFAEGGPSFFFQGASPSREGYNLGASITLLFKECLLFTVAYDYTNFSSLEIQSAWARVRWLFL